MGPTTYYCGKGGYVYVSKVESLVSFPRTMQPSSSRQLNLHQAKAVSNKAQSFANSVGVAGEERREKTPTIFFS